MSAIGSVFVGLAIGWLLMGLIAWPFGVRPTDFWFVWRWRR